MSWTVTQLDSLNRSEIENRDNTTEGTVKEA